MDFVYRKECSLPIKSALSFTTVAFREISSTAALMKLLLPIEIHVAVCDLQATHRPTITGLLLKNCAIQVSLLRIVVLKPWNQENSGKITGTKRGYTLSITEDALSELKGLE